MFNYADTNREGTVNSVETNNARTTFFELMHEFLLLIPAFLRLDIKFNEFLFYLLKLSGITIIFYKPLIRK